VARLLLGVSGGIAAYKALELVRLATAEGHAVRVIQTAGAQRFVGAASFAAMSGAPVLRDQFERDPLRGSFPGDPLPDHDPASHLALSAAADVFLIAPASANTLAKLAHGHADNLLTATALGAACPLILAPAMNDRMWAAPATQANVALLRERGVEVLEPGSGRLATAGEWGTGRLPEPAELLAAVRSRLACASWQGLRTLVTAGGTREPIDAVRYLGNRSSGRMGFALADAAAARGSHVVVLAANVALARAPGLSYRDVGSAAELAAAAAAEFAEADVLIMCAAVADFRPARVADGKIAKAARQTMTLELEATEDVLAGLSARRREGQVLVGFAAEHGAGALERARAKLIDKGLDAIVCNDVSAPGIGFDATDNAVTIFTREGERAVGPAPKRAIAEAVLDTVEALRGAATGAARTRG
jgi:phosphopantothenoylcysteine decarboxylase/phosphopantothenate--cysteine ligase